MSEKGGPTTTTSVFDPAAGKWSDGPTLPGEEGIEGFGCVAATCNGRLFATTYVGTVWCLSTDGGKWEQVAQLERPRFFHRLVSKDNSSLIVVGGGNMEEGKDRSLELITATLKP